jgi:hypothetical protein
MQAKEEGEASGKGEDEDGADGEEEGGDVDVDPSGIDEVGSGHLSRQHTEMG